MLGRVRRRVRDGWRGETADTLFDLYDVAAVNRLLAEYVPGVTLTADTRDAEAAPVRFVLGTLAADRRLARRFPRPLTNPAFADWMAARPDLSPAAAAAVRATFDQNLAVRPDRVFDARSDLRAVFPLGLTPHPQRAAYLGWMLGHGRRDLGLTADECLWWAYQQDAAPDRGLEASYRLHPDWQRDVPDALTPAGWPRLKAYLADRYRLRGRWFGRATLPPQPDATGPGVNLIAHHKYESGLQQAAIGLGAALAAAGYAVSRRDLPVGFHCDWADPTPTRGLEPFPLTVWVSAVNTFPDDSLPLAGLHPRPGVRRVAVWYWELEEVPAEWVTRLGWPDEVWAPTRFVADAVRPHLSRPVVPMLPGVELPAFTPRPRSHFGLPADRFLVLFSFDMGSAMARKNPLGLVAAFRAAFRPDDRVHLCIKVSRGDTDRAALAELRAACEAAGATLLDTVLPRADAVALLAAADCYASLHRSEGLGLGLAESMLLGKPVVATGYSGNLDFMTPDTGFLVSHTRVPVVAPGSHFAGPGRWAEPDVGHAAELLRRVYTHRDEAAAVAARGQAAVQELLSPAAYSRRVADRLRVLGGGQ